MRKEIETLKERAQNPGEVFSRFEVLDAIAELERFQAAWVSETSAQIADTVSRFTDLARECRRMVPPDEVRAAAFEQAAEMLPSPD